MAFEKLMNCVKDDLSTYLDRLALEMETAMGKMIDDVKTLGTKLEEEKAERIKLQGELDTEKKRRTEIEQKLDG